MDPNPNWTARPPPATPAAHGRSALGSLTEAKSVDGPVTAAAAAAGPMPPPPSRRRSAQAVGWERDFDRVTTASPPGTGAVFRVYHAGSAGPRVLCLHGAGCTGLTFGPLAALLKASCRLAAPDLRGHGSTDSSPGITDSSPGITDSSPGGEDLSLGRLVDDVVALAACVWPPEPNDSSPRIRDSSPGIVLLGHSLGGALAARAACRLPGISGLIVIDAVEGTALAALPSIAAGLCERPAAFPSLAKAVEWAVGSGMSKRWDSACLAVPAQLRLGESRDSSPGKYEWRTPLGPTAPFWDGWYRGLSAAFLSAPAPKLLLLAGADTLDTPLTVAHMQGRFQLAVMPQAGHAIQEDEPEKTAEVVVAFLARHRLLGPTGAAVGAGGVPIGGGWC